MESNEKDKRIPCKYGSKCYQQNELHHKKYNHPPKRELDLLDDVKKPVKKHKLVAKVGVKKNMNPDKNECSTSSENNTEAPPDKIRTPPKLTETPVKQTNAQETCALGNEGSSEGPVTSEEKSDKSAEDGEDNIPSSPEDVRESIKQKFLLEMPEDFYSFWSFCENISKDKPSEAFKDVGLYLVGPFDVLSGDLKKVKHRRLSSYLRHWRYYYDPPEFQTVVKGDNKQLFHMGYYRDDPQSPPCFVASNCAAVSCIIVPMAENLFGAINSYLESKKKTCGPFILMKVSRLQSSLQSWAKKNNFTLDVSTSRMKARQQKVVAKTFHKAGIVVPVDKKSDLGYREMLEDEASLKRLLKRVVDSTSDSERTSCLSKLQPVLTAASIATDECDFGTGLELGIDLFSYGGDVFHNTIVQYLNTAYTLLQRQEFSQIIQAHLKLRKNGCNLSMLDEDSQ